MQTKMCVSLIKSAHVLWAFTQMRQEWEQAADGDNLLKVKGSVGLLLADFANVLRLTHEEQTTAPGECLTTQLQDIFVTSVGNNMEEL